MAQRLVAREALLGDEPTTSSERWSEWSPERDALARIEDRLQELTQAVVASAGAKPREFRPATRPVSAIQRARGQRRRRDHQTLKRRMLPPED